MKNLDVKKVLQFANDYEYIGNVTGQPSAVAAVARCLRDEINSGQLDAKGDATIGAVASAVADAVKFERAAFAATYGAAQTKIEELSKDLEHRRRQLEESQNARKQLEAEILVLKTAAEDPVRPYESRVCGLAVEAFNPDESHKPSQYLAALRYLEQAVHDLLEAEGRFNSDTEEDNLEDSTILPPAKRYGIFFKTATGREYRSQNTNTRGTYECREIAQKAADAESARMGIQYYVREVCNES